MSDDTDALLKLAGEYLDASGNEGVTLGELFMLQEAKASASLDRDETYSLEDVGDDLAYQSERSAAVACGEPGLDNCRHTWNAQHPDDQVTVEEQDEWQRTTSDRLAAAQRDAVRTREMATRRVRQDREMATRRVRQDRAITRPANWKPGD